MILKCTFPVAARLGFVRYTWIVRRRRPVLAEGTAGASTPRATSRRQSAAVALAPLMEPLVDLCLELGITSPEMERVLRAVFVERARRLLSRTPSRRRSVSDVRIALMIGIHRNFVRQIRTTQPRVQLEKVQGRHRGAALLHAWATDWTYLNSAGHPRDLPIHALEGEPSFERLARQHMPGVATGTAVAELRRSGAVRLLPDERVRLRSRTPRSLGLSAASLAVASEWLQDLAATVLYNLKAPEQPRFCEAIDTIAVEEERLALVRQIIARRTRTLLDEVSAELAEYAVESAAAHTVQVSLAAFSSERSP